MAKFKHLSCAAAICLWAALFIGAGEVQAQCSIQGANDIDFGKITGMSNNPQTVSGQVNFGCRGGHSVIKYCVTITESHNGVGSRLALYRNGKDSRQPADGEYLLFRFFTDQGEWGGSTAAGSGGIPGTSGYSGETDTSGNFTVPFTARLDAPITVLPGAFYSQNFTIRVASNNRPDVNGADLCYTKSNTPSGTAYDTYKKLTVKAQAVPGCLLQTAPIAFGSQMSLASPHTATGQVKVVCSGGTGYSLALDAGQNADADGTNRMSCNNNAACKGNYISYLLYADSSATTVWNNVKNPGFVQKGTMGSTGGTDSYQVTGKTLAPQPTPPAGAYRDTVTAILTVNTKWN